jgi:lycopene cyclase CruA
MNEVLYLEVPTSDLNAVRQWLQHDFEVPLGTRELTPDGIRLHLNIDQGHREAELVAFLWSLNRTTYLKVFRWNGSASSAERQMLQALTQQAQQCFPNSYPAPPEVDLSKTSIFEALAPYYPKTAQYFQRFPNGEYDLKRVYWWEQRWRSEARNRTQPRSVVQFQTERSLADLLAEQPAPSEATHTATATPAYDLIYVGGALGSIHAALMAQLGYKVLLLERLPFGRMNREWNISRQEFQGLIDLGLFTAEEFECMIAREYVDGFNKFFDANNPAIAKAPILHTPTVLNIAIDSEELLRQCGEKLRAAGGEIWDETEFQQVTMASDGFLLSATHLPSQTLRQVTGRLLVDAMGTASPIAWQLNGTRAFDSVCPTVGAVIDGGFEPGVWDSQYGDVLNSHGDISRGRQLIWELFPGRDRELTFYLFHYHQVHPDNPGSLLEMYEDFFTILPEYRRCDLDQLTWKKATFGYIPGFFSIGSDDRRVACDRLVAVGDAASLQSPLVFTGFGSLVRNLPRLTVLLDFTLRHDLLQAKHLNQIRAFQSNIAVTWLFSKGMMVPTGKQVSPERVNAMLNTFFGILAEEPSEVADRFIKDRAGWVTFNRMALRAAWKNPALLLWIWELAGSRDMVRWVGSYLNFTVMALLSWLLGWLPAFTRTVRPWLAPRYPALWFWLLARSYAVTYGMGAPTPVDLTEFGRSPASLDVPPLADPDKISEESMSSSNAPSH